MWVGQRGSQRLGCLPPAWLSQDDVQPLRAETVDCHWEHFGKYLIVD